MQEEVRIQEALKYWDLRNPHVDEQLKEDSERLIFRIKTDTGFFVLKGFPSKVP